MLGFPGSASGKEAACQYKRCKRHGCNPWVRKIPGGGHGNRISILAWRIPWTEEHGGLQSMGSLRAGHD